MASPPPSMPSGTDAASVDISKKRPIEEGFDGDDRSKRANLGADPDKPNAIKLLVANKDAGTVIGRSGATIQAIQAKTGCRVRVSNNGDYFPGTQDRVVLVTGTTESVTTGVTLVLSELFENAEEIQKNGGVQPETVMLSVLIPEKASGLIIGRGGESIREMVEQSAAKIQLTAKDKQPPGLDERVLTCTGNLPQVKKALELVALKICEDPTASYTNMTTQYTRYNQAASAGLLSGLYGGRGGVGTYGGLQGMSQLGGMDPYAQQMAAYGGVDPYAGYGAAYSGLMAGQDLYSAAATYSQAAVPVPNAAGGVTYTLYVPDACVPAIMGRGGVIIKDLMEQSGAQIKVSQKGEYAPGTTNRIVTISGNPQSAQIAHTLVQAKIPHM